MDDICSICLDNNNKKSILLKCNHKFHKECLYQWLKVKPICPLCQTNLISKFRIYQKKYIFFKNYFVLDINTEKDQIKIYKINNSNKVIWNPFFKKMNNRNSNETNIFDIDEDNDFKTINKNEYINNLEITINMKKIKKIVFVYKYGLFKIYYNNSHYEFYYDKSKIQIIFNIIKKYLEKLHRL